MAEGKGPSGSASGIDTVVFDLGGVLIDWNPRYLYRKLFAEEAAMEHFLATVCTQAWHEQTDAGRPAAEVTAELTARHPDMAELIEAFYRRSAEMIAGSFEDTVAILDELRRAGRRLYVLSNWPVETFVQVRARFGFLDWFDGMVISGEVGMKKPGPRIFGLLIERFDIAAGRAAFIDDRPYNAAAADAAGITGLHFTAPGALRDDLIRLGIL